MRARVHTVRGKGKSCFLVLRQRTATGQVSVCPEAWWWPTKNDASCHCMAFHHSSTSALVLSPKHCGVLVSLLW